jgi:hypothetical protein
VATNRRPLQRRRNPGIDEDILALFVKLERGPARERESFSDGSHRLARRLNLTAEWWMGQSPCDDSRRPAHPPWCAAHDAWHRCRDIRERLLRAAAERGLMTVADLPAIARKARLTGGEVLG